MKKWSIIIAAFNCQEILDRTLFHLIGGAEYPDNLEIIVVDDGSDTPITLASFASNCLLVRHKRNLGVGAAFDSGMNMASNDSIILMGADIIVPESWDKKAFNIVSTQPEAITCSVCSGFDKEEQAFMKGRHLRYGAHILRYHETPMRRHTQTDIIQAQWNRTEPVWNEDGMARIGCILGAFYVTTKQVYTAIGGFMGHKGWGGLEPLISIRAKRSGYPLYVARDLETAHNYGRVQKTHERPGRWDTTLYNKMFMAHTMFEDPTDMMALLYTHGPTNWLSVASKRILNGMDNGTIPDIREFHRQNWVNGLIKKTEDI